MENENEAPGSKGAGISTRVVEIATAVVILFMGGAVAVDSYRLGAGWGSDGPQAGYFPFYVGSIICIASLVTLGQVIFGKGGQREKIFVEWSQLRLVLSVLVPAALYIGGIQIVGLYIASAVYIAAFMIWLGNYGWLKSLALGITVSMLGFFTFEIWFQVPLYKGILDPLGFLGY